MTSSPWRPSAHCRAPTDRTSLYEDITNKIIAQLEAGRLPWVQPWGSPGVNAPLGIPKNAGTGRRYSGINVLILWGAVVQHGYAVQSWLTFRQAVGLGGNVRKGEHGTTVVYADRFVPDDERQRAFHEGDPPAPSPSSNASPCSTSSSARVCPRTSPRTRHPPPHISSCRRSRS